jgi:hypothetical protein
MKNRYKILSLRTMNVLKKSTVETLCIVMFTLFCLTAMSCNKLRNLDVGGNTNPPPQNTDSNFTLKGTQWKLVGIVDAQTNTLTELEPKNCEECYTFTFETDTTANGKSISCGAYIIGLNPIEIPVDKALENFDGSIYTALLLSVKSYTVDNNALRLYFTDRRNMYPPNSFLLYKPIKIVEP